MTRRIHSLRQACTDDTARLCHLLNAIVRAGGTTAIVRPLTHGEFNDYFLTGPGHLSCVLATAENGQLTGFQALEWKGDGNDGLADIATFIGQGFQAQGVGSALFPVTLEMARDAGVQAINATIRADNAGGLAYYRALGFIDHSVARDVPLLTGQQVDRISKRLRVTR